MPGLCARGAGVRQARPLLTPLCDCPGDELELIRPSVYRNVARQLNISLQSETVVTDAFLAVASQIFSGGRPGPPCCCRPGSVGWRKASGAGRVQQVASTGPGATLLLYKPPRSLTKQYCVVLPWVLRMGVSAGQLASGLSCGSGRY